VRCSAVAVCERHTRGEYVLDDLCYPFEALCCHCAVFFVGVLSITCLSQLGISSFAEAFCCFCLLAGALVVLCLVDVVSISSSYTSRICKKAGLNCMVFCDNSVVARDYAI
jgi:hypothetical protein